MISCEDAKRLVIWKLEGTAPLWSPALDAHLSVCAACRETEDTQRAVSVILRERPDEPIPSTFWMELAERLDAERARGWIPAASWRTWSLRLFPLAVAATILAVVVTGGRDAAAEADLSSALMSMALPPIGSLLLAAPRVNDDSLMIALLANEWWPEERP